MDKNPTLIDNFCRACMNADGEYGVEDDSQKRKSFSIFIVPESMGCENITIMELLMLITPQLNIESGDMLPKTLCETCLDSLTKAYDFQKMCIRVEQILRQMIKEEITDESIMSKDPLKDILMDPSTHDAEVTKNVNNLNNILKEEVDEPLIDQNESTISRKCDMEDKEKNELENKSDEDSSDVDWDMDSDWEIPLSNAKSKNISKVVNAKIKNEMNDSSEKSKSFEEQDSEKVEQGDQITKESTRNISDTKDSVNKNFGCDECGKRLATSKSLKRHKLIHLRSVKIENQEPEVTTESKTESERTAKNTKDDENKKFVCDECGNRLSTRKSWKRHKKIHLRPTTEKQRNTQVKTKYECEICQKVFPQNSSLKEHLRKHTGETPYLCSECGKSFKSLSNMKQHFLRHGTDRPHACPDCPKRFPCFSDLASHKAVHSKIKSHVCDLCGAAFVKPYLLKKHKMYHTGEKKHKCDYCDKRFVIADHCQRHMRTHTGEKPYKCKYCERAFAQSNDLVKHLRGHIGDNVYRCDLCPQAFRLQIDLRAHFYTHKDDDEETKIRNLQALREEEQRLEVKFALINVRAKR